MSDRLTELRIENRRLKNQVQNLENKVLSLIGMINFVSSGGKEKPNVLNDLMINFIRNSQTQINIVAPKIDKFYANELIRKAERGIPVLIITNDRSGIPEDFIPSYDTLKTTQGISIINNRNVRYLLAFNQTEGLYAGGSLDKEELTRSILIVTTMKAPEKLRIIAEIFNIMLPSFMRR